MKHVLLALVLLSFSFVVMADLAVDLQRICQSPEVRSEIGTTGSCSVVIAPKKIKQSGTCQGTFMTNLPCTIKYSVDEAGGFLNLICGTDLLNPVIEQEMEAKGLGLESAAIVRTEDGRTVVVNDKSSYSLVSNEMVEMTFVETAKALFKGNSRSTTISINLQSGKSFLKNVYCR